MQEQSIHQPLCFLSTEISCLVGGRATDATAAMQHKRLHLCCIMLWSSCQQRRQKGITAQNAMYIYSWTSHRARQASRSALNRHQH